MWNWFLKAIVRKFRMKSLFVMRMAFLSRTWQNLEANSFFSTHFYFMGISNISRFFLLCQLRITMQLRLKAESHHWWLWNELLFLVHFKIPISSSQTRDEILKERRIESAGRRNFSCYPTVKSLNERILRIGDCVPATSAVFVSVDKGRIPSSCYPLP